jgi:tetrahydromethanopterin S-methyltransferase subunit B
MAQMLPMVQIVPEMNFAYDPVTGILGSSLGSGVVLLSMDEVNEQVAKVELAADELMSSLDPYTSPDGAYPGREGSYVTAGLLTNMVYGFLLAAFIIFAALPLLHAWGVL